MENEVAVYKFGGNIISASSFGVFTITLVNGGVWVFDLNELNKLYEAISKLEKAYSDEEEVAFWRTNKTKLIRVFLKHYGSPFPSEIHINEGGTREGYFWQSEIPLLQRFIKYFIPDTNMKNIPENTSPKTKNEKKSSTNLTNKEQQKDNKVFIIHGQNHGIKETVARFVESLGLQAIILHEKPNSGRTIIEKFYDYSNVTYAIVLLTADDRGGLVNELYESQKLRARQNVILELGFFLGKLGRKNVCCLYQDGVDMPSDYSGVLFIKLDTENAWKLSLTRELTAAGVNVDLKKLII